MGLGESLRLETVADLPLREAITVSADTPVRAVIERMRQQQLGCAFIVDAAGKPLGAFSERGLIELLVHERRPVDDLPVGQYRDEKWHCVRKTDPIDVLFELARKHGVRFVCVTDADGRVVALAGQKSVSEYIAEHFPQQVMIQRVGGRPGHDTREGA